MTTFGLTTSGFVAKRQQDIITEIQAALQSALGQNISLLPQAVFGQIIGVFSEREALLWELAQAVYASQYPTGSEGTSVDNILALNNIRRLPARATKTSLANSLGVPGFVCYGTPGTVIPAGSLVSVSGNPSLQFSIDSVITINAAVNAVQLISFYGGIPTTGYFNLQIIDPNGNTLVTPNIPWDAPADITFLSWAIAPTSGNFVLGIGPLLTASLAYNASATDVQNAIRALSGYGSVVVMGSVAIGFSINWGTLSQPCVTANATKLSFSADPVTGQYIINLNGTPSALIDYNASAALVQAALNAISGYEKIIVTGSAALATGLYINWGWTTPATVTISSNSTGVTITPASTNTLNQATTVINSVQSAINALYDSITSLFPYTDVTVSGSFIIGLFTVTFGANSPAAGQPASGAQTQKTFTVPTNTLMDGTVVINVNPHTTSAGLLAQGTGSATCTATGPNYVPAGYLSVIGSPVSGWTSVNNPLDCVTGSNIESDTAALNRRATQLSALANGPLQAIAQKVSRVTNVIQALGFENTSLASDQVVTFTGTASAGSFTLGLTGPSGLVQTTGPIAWNAKANIQVIKFSGVPTGGSFTLTFGAQTTASIAYNATFLAVQTAIRTLTGYENTVVTGDFSQGFSMSFGIMPQLPVSATSSLAPGVTITTIPSVQSRINELTSYFVARVIGSIDAGLLISFYGSAGGQPQLLAIATNSLTGISAIVVSYGRPGKSFEIVVNDNNLASDTEIANAIFSSKPAGIQSYGTSSVQVSDAFGNAYDIFFSRPQLVPIYIVLTLQTDLLTEANPKFNPASIFTIQQDLVTVGETFPVGGQVIGFGSNGLIGAFNSVPGITSYTMYFGTSPNPTTNSNIQLLPEQVAQFETYNVLIAYT